MKIMKMEFLDLLVKKKLGSWSLLSIILILSFLIGLYVPSFEFTMGILIASLSISLILIINYLLLKISSKRYPISMKKTTFSIWMMISVNSLFAFMIGITIPYMESDVRYNMALVMIPLSILLHLVLVDRFYFLMNSSVDNNSDSKEKFSKIKDSSMPVIEFEGKNYIFTLRSIIILAIGTPLLSYLIYLFFDNQMNYWLHEIVVKQTVYFLNVLFDMNARAEYVPSGKYHWRFVIPNRGQIYFETFCTGVQAICVFAGIIILIPHSLDKKTNEDIVWRKTKSLIISSLIFYVVNIIRMIIQIYLFYIGYAWEDIHYSISAASSFIAAIIILLLHKWIPEFIISIIYTGNLIGKKLKESRGIQNDDNIKDSV
ncbi:MAG: hypothetical protein EU539_03800 [Promethearchaeota archaeon]|nr:MAG: hypothetical protein EU539_03800 [Candidatus Lokiarchaeota archaeon]